MSKKLSAVTKLASIRTAMAAGDWEKALGIAAKFQRLGEHGSAIRTARDAMNNRHFYEQLGKNVDELIEAGIAALKVRYDRSWQSVQSESELEEEDDA